MAGMVNARRGKVQNLIRRILADLDHPVYKTSLVKLTYLVDYFHIRQTGRSVTDIRWVWDNFGPNGSRNEIVKEADALVAAGDIESNSAPEGDTARFYRSRNDSQVTYSPILEAIIGEVLTNYAPLSVEELKQESKRTLPFQNSRPGRQLILTQMERAIPPVTAEDWSKHQQERLLGEGKTVGELRAKYKMD